MDKKTIGRGVQLIALIMFIGMALACASTKSIVDDVEGKFNGKSNDFNNGACIENLTDSTTVVNDFDYALN